MSRDEYYEKYKSKHADRRAFDACRDYEDYIRKLTSFVFEPPIKAGLRPSQPLLPAALPLMGSVLGGLDLPCGGARASGVPERATSGAKHRVVEVRKREYCKMVRPSELGH